MFKKINWDALGITTSIACAIHCAILPLVFSSFPLFGVNIITDPFFEYGMIGLAFIIGIVSLRHGYKKHHHKYLPMIIFSFGFIFLLSKQWVSNWEIPFLLVAVCFIVTAHLLNFRLCRAHNHAHKEDCNH